jgi:hypothetical protein
VLFTQLAVLRHLDVGAAALHDEGVGAARLDAQVLPRHDLLVDRVGVGRHAVGGEREDRLRHPAVEAVLRVADVPDDPVGRVVAAAAVAPDGREREFVVPVGALARGQHARIGEEHEVGAKRHPLDHGRVAHDDGVAHFLVRRVIFLPVHVG